MIGDILKELVGKIEDTAFEEYIDKFEVELVRIICTQLLILSVHLAKVNNLNFHFHRSSPEVLR